MEKAVAVIPDPQLKSILNIVEIVLNLLADKDFAKKFDKATISLKTFKEVEEGVGRETVFLAVFDYLKPPYLDRYLGPPPIPLWCALPQVIPLPPYLATITTLGDITTYPVDQGLVRFHWKYFASTGAQHQYDVWVQAPQYFHTTPTEIQYFIQLFFSPELFQQSDLWRSPEMSTRLQQADQVMLIFIRILCDPKIRELANNPDYFLQLMAIAKKTKAMLVKILPEPSLQQVYVLTKFRNLMGAHFSGTVNLVNLIAKCFTKLTPVQEKNLKAFLIQAPVTPHPWDLPEISPNEYLTQSHDYLLGTEYGQKIPEVPPLSETTVELRNEKLAEDFFLKWVRQAAIERLHNITDPYDPLYSYIYGFLKATSNVQGLMANPDFIGRLLDASEWNLFIATVLPCVVAFAGSAGLGVPSQLLMPGITNLYPQTTPFAQVVPSIAPAMTDLPVTMLLEGGGSISMVIKYDPLPRELMDDVATGVGSSLGGTPGGPTGSGGGGGGGGDGFGGGFMEGGGRPVPPEALLTPVYVPPWDPLAQQVAETMARLQLFAAILLWALDTVFIVRAYLDPEIPDPTNLDLTAWGLYTAGLAVTALPTVLAALGWSIAGTVTATALSIAGAAILSVASYISIYASFLSGSEAWSQFMLDRVVIDITPSLGPTSNRSLVRNGGFRVGDEFGMQMQVKNTGKMEWTRSLSFVPVPDYAYTMPYTAETDETQIGGPFWYASHLAAGTPGNTQIWGEWAGPWEGPAVNWNYWDLGGDIEILGIKVFNWDPAYSNTGDLLFSEGQWQDVGIYEDTGIYYRNFEAGQASYEMTVPLLQPTSNLAISVQSQIATTYQDGSGHNDYGRTNHTASDPVEILLGDTNGDGYLDPLFEQGVPVLETTLDGFLAACVNVTPALTLEDLLHNYSSATGSYQWKDAADYLSQALVLANTQIGFTEAAFNATVARLQNFTGANANISWRPFDGLAWNTTAVPEDIAENYYLLNTANATEWSALLAGSQGQVLLDAGWRAVLPAWASPTESLFAEDFSKVEELEFPADWVRNSGQSKVMHRYDGDAVLTVMSPIDTSEITTISREFGPMLKGRVRIDHLYFGSGITLFGLAAAGASPTDWSNVAMMAWSDGFYFYNGQIFPWVIPEDSMDSVIIDFDAIAGNATLFIGPMKYTVSLQNRGVIPTQFRIITMKSDRVSTYCLSSLSIRNMDVQDIQLNGFGLTSPHGQIIVPKRWVTQSQQSFKFINVYSSILNFLPCRTNINVTYSWGTGQPILDAGNTFSGTLNFTYNGLENPVVNWSLSVPPGWNIQSYFKRQPLKEILQVPLIVEVPFGTPAGTYYLDFVERLDDGSYRAGNVTFACRIPVRVRYNGTWALDVAGLSDTLAPGSSNAWATLFNNGTAPQALYITGDGVPLDWLAADGYAPVARWDFNGGTGGWAPVGTGAASFEADRTSSLQMNAVRDHNKDEVYKNSFLVSQYYDDFFGWWAQERTYFTIPAATLTPTYVNPRSAIWHGYIVVASASAPYPDLIVSPADGPFDPNTLTWRTQPGFMPDQHAAALLTSTIPAGGWITIPDLLFATTYAVWVEDCGQGRAAGYGPGELQFGGYLMHVYDKIATDGTNLVLQSNVNEVVTASKLVDALIQPGDRIRITYENAGTTGAALGAWESFALTGSGWQERTFIAEGFYTLANLTVSAQVGPGASFRVDSLSVERALSRHLPLSELIFAGDTATPEMYGWAAVFGSGVTSMSFVAPVTNAGYVDRSVPNTTFNTRELWVGNDPYNTPNRWVSFLEVPAPPATMSAYSSFGVARHPLLVAKYNTPMAIRAYPCGAFNETNLTYANHPAIQQDLGIDGDAWGDDLDPFWAWDVTDFPSDHVCLNATQPGWYIFPSDEVQEIISPRVVYSIPKWGVAGGALVVQSDQGETFRVSRALNSTGPELTVQAGDKVWASFETTSAGGATLVLVNANPLGANLTFPLAAATDQKRGTIYREFVIPAGGKYTTILIDGMLGAGQNFSLGFAGVYRYQPFGTPLASANIGGFYTETILPSQFTQYAPLAGGCFTFDDTTDGFTGTDVTILDGSLTLAPSGASTVIATCALAGLIIPAGTRARARYNSTPATNAHVTFMTGGGDLPWVLPVAIPDSWQEASYLFTQDCVMTQILIGGDFTAFTNLSLDYLLLEVPAAAPCVLPEVAGRRDVVALKNVAACGGAANYSFPVPQTQGRLDFSIYAPGTNATLAITLEGAGGAGINLMIADWQLWLGNLSGAFAAAGIYGGWHSLSIAWDCATHNYTVWYFNQTLVEANYTAGWGILNFTGTAITGVRIGTADARSAFYLDGVYFDPVPAQPSNLSLVETFRPGSGIYVNLLPGEEWTLQLAAPPRSPLTAPCTYPVHLAIYDASTGQLIGLVHKDITIPAFYDIGLTCSAPVQVQQAASQTSADGTFTFAGTLTNLGNMEQTLSLATTGLDSRGVGTFYLDINGAWEIGDTLILAPGQAQSWKLEILGAPALVCTFAIEAQSADNLTSIPVTFVYNAPPVIEGGHIQGPFVVEWQPAGKDLLFTAWDNTTQDAWFEAYWETTYLGQGTWASGEAINISLDPLFAAGASILGTEQDVRLFLRDGYSHPYTPSNIYTITIIVDDILPAAIAPADVVTTWENPLGTLSWDVIDNGAWDPASGWQDDFGDGTLGPQWLPADVVEHNGTLSLCGPVLDAAGTRLFAPAPAGEDFAVVARLASVPYTISPELGAGIVIPTSPDTNYFYISWKASPANPGGTSWNLVEEFYELGYVNRIYFGPVSGRAITLGVVVHGVGSSATYDLWYCVDDAAWALAEAGRQVMSHGPPTVRRFGLCASAWTLASEFDWVRCQTLRAAPGATYTVNMDGTPVASGGWAGFGTVSLSLDDLRPLGPALVGLHDFTLVLNDPVGGSTSSSVHVDISQVAPVLSQPPDYSGVEGDAPTITWDILDNYATTPTYTIYLGPLGSDGTSITSGTWVSGGIISITLPAMTHGTLDCRLVATNGLGGSSEDHVILTIVQPTLVPAPVVTSSVLPASAGQEMVWETRALTLDVTLTTTAEVTLVAGAWDGNPVIGVPPELAAEGAYFSLAASDETAIQFPLTMVVTFPYNPIYGYSEADLAQWVGAYMYNEETGAWELAGCSVLGVHLHDTMEGRFVDVTLSVAHFSIFAVGLWNLPPTLSTPDDVAYLGGSTGHAIAWQVTDDTITNPIYTITRDGTEVASGAWTLDNCITINVDGLAPGAYDFMLFVEDGRYGTTSDSVMVVVDNFAPAISAPADITYTWGTTGNAIIWHLTDETVQGPIYTLTKDGQVVASGAWPVGKVLTWGVDGLGVGIYNYRLEGADGLTGTASDEVRVTVLNTLPVLSAPLDINFEYGGIAPTIAWTVADGTVLAGTYTVTLGGFPVAQGTWISGDSIAWTPGDLLPGTWAATLTVSDGYGGVTSDSLAVTVTNAPPAITGPHSAVFEAGNASAGVWLTITDPSTASDAAYSIYRNGTRVASGRWASGGSIYVDLRFTPPGRHDIKVIAWDGIGGMATHSLLATTTNMAPVVIAPPPVTFEAGTATPVLNWTITDESAENATYALAINGITFANNTWVSGDVVSLAVGSWMPGTYNVTLAAADGWGAVSKNSTLVVVTNAAPVVLVPPPIAYETGDPRPVATFVVDDVSTRDPSYAAYLDGSQVASGTWASGVPITIPASGLAPGSYVLTVVASDGYGATGENGTTITVGPDDDTTCDLANLTCSATPGSVTFSCDLIDPSGYASLDWVALNGTLIPRANLSLSLNGTRATVSFNYTFVASGTYVLQLQLTDGDNDWPGDGATGVFSCTFEIYLADAVETVLGIILRQLDDFIATARGISDRCWRNRIIACAQAARHDVTAALAFYQRGRTSKALARARAARALASVTDLLVQVGQKVTRSHDPVWGELHAQAGAIQTNLESVIHLLEAARPHGHHGHGRCDHHP